jgi:two-component system response regulator
MDHLAHALEQRPVIAGTISTVSAIPSLSILHVDDDPKDHALFKAAGVEAKVPISWQHINSAQGAISYLQRLPKAASAAAWPHLVLLDVAMPGGSGLKVLEFTCSKSEFQKLPIIVFSGSKDPKVTARAGKLGAKSVLAKPSDFAEAVQLIASLYRLFSLSAQRLAPVR